MNTSPQIVDISPIEEENITTKERIRGFGLLQKKVLWAFVGYLSQLLKYKSFNIDTSFVFMGGTYRFRTHIDLDGDIINMIPDMKHFIPHKDGYELYEHVFMQHQEKVTEEIKFIEASLFFWKSIGYGIIYFLFTLKPIYDALKASFEDSQDLTPLEIGLDMVLVIAPLFLRPYIMQAIFWILKHTLLRIIQWYIRRNIDFSIQ